MVAMNVINSASGGSAEPAPAYLYYPFGNFCGLYGTLAPILQGLRGYLVDRGAAATVVDQTRGGNGELRGRLRHGFEEQEVLAEDRVRELQFAGDTQRCGRELRAARLVVEPDLRRVLRFGDAANLVQEVHVP